MSFVIFAELLLGLLLVFQIRLRLISAIGLAFVAILTVIYTYRLLFKNIEDYGCFGHISFLNTSPIFTFIRNAGLLFLLFVCWRKGNNSKTLNWEIVLASLLAIGVGIFMCGYTFRFSQKTDSKQKYAAKAVSETTLSEFITTSPDSSYLIFVFSYNCPHCINSLGNLEQYKKIGVVDKIIGIAQQNQNKKEEFIRVFNPEFEIRSFSTDTIFKLTKNFPKSYYIKNDSVIFEILGELPSAYFFNKPSNP